MENRHAPVHNDIVEAHCGVDVFRDEVSIINEGFVGGSAVMFTNEPIKLFNRTMEMLSQDDGIDRENEYIVHMTPKAVIISPRLKDKDKKQTVRELILEKSSSFHTMQNLNTELDYNICEDLDISMDSLDECPFQVVEQMREKMAKEMLDTDPSNFDLFFCDRCNQYADIDMSVEKEPHSLYCESCANNFHFHG